MSKVLSLIVKRLSGDSSYKVGILVAKRRSSSSSSAAAATATTRLRHHHRHHHNPAVYLFFCCLVFRSSFCFLILRICVHGISWLEVRFGRSFCFPVVGHTSIGISIDFTVILTTNRVCPEFFLPWEEAETRAALTLASMTRQERHSLMQATGKSGSTTKCFCN